MAKRTLVIIGGDAGGMGAASQARRRDPDLEIIAYERGEHTSYTACGIPYLVGGLVERPEQLIARKPETFRKRYDIQVQTRHEVVRIEPDRQRIRVERLDDDHVFWQRYDELLIATGAHPVVPDLPDVDAEGIFTLSDLSSGITVWEYVKETEPQRAVVVGGGYVGLEMADVLRMRGLDVSLIDIAPEVMVTMDQEMGALASQALRDIGVHLYLQEGLEGFDAHNGRIRAVLTDQRTLPADIVILGMGVLPNSELAGAAGIPLGVSDAIRVDSHMRTGIAHIWAAGDCTESTHRVSGKPVYVPLGTVANKTGRVAGLNLAGIEATFPGVLGTAITKVGDTEISRTGLNTAEITALGWEFVTVQITDRTRAGYFPGASDITVRLLAEKGTGRLLGGQIVGGPGSGKRIDTVIAAITAGMSAQDLVNMDLSYAPPFSPVWDPVQTAARVMLSDL